MGVLHIRLSSIAILAETADILSDKLPRIKAIKARLKLIWLFMVTKLIQRMRRNQILQHSTLIWQELSCQMEHRLSSSSHKVQSKRNKEVRNLHLQKNIYVNTLLKIKQKKKTIRGAVFVRRLRLVTYIQRTLLLLTELPDMRSSVIWSIMMLISFKYLALSRFWSIFASKEFKTTLATRSYSNKD